jgi:hypothetical protein
MATKYLVLLGVLCLILCVGFVMCVDDVHAQGKGIAGKKDGELGNKEFDQDQLPGKLEVGLGLGSIVVMIAVVKYL